MAFGGGISAPSAPPPAPKVEDKAVQEAAADAARRRKLGKGYRSTILGSTMLAPDSPALGETLGS